MPSGCNRGKPARLKVCGMRQRLSWKSIQGTQDVPWAVRITLNGQQTLEFAMGWNEGHSTSHNLSALHVAAGLIFNIVELHCTEAQRCRGYNYEADCFANGMPVHCGSGSLIGWIFLKALLFKPDLDFNPSFVKSSPLCALHIIDTALSDSINVFSSTATLRILT